MRAPFPIIDPSFWEDWILFWRSFPPPRSWGLLPFYSFYKLHTLNWGLWFGDNFSAVGELHAYCHSCSLSNSFFFLHVERFNERREEEGKSKGGWPRVHGGNGGVGREGTEGKRQESREGRGRAREQKLPVQFLLKNCVFLYIVYFGYLWVYLGMLFLFIEFYLTFKKSFPVPCFSLISD